MTTERMEPRSVDLLVTNGFVITMDDQRTMYRSGAVAIGGEEILEVGPRAALERRYVAARTLDVAGHVVMPGLVNAHRHVLNTPRGTLHEGRTTLENLRNFVYPAFAALTDEDNYWATLVSSAEMIRNGTTTFQEPGCTHLPSVIAAIAEVGIRCSMGHWAWDQLGPNAAQCPDYFYRLSTDECLQLMRTSFEQVDGAAGGRIKGAITLEGVGTCSDDLSVGARHLADELGAITVQHKATSVQEVQRELEAFGHRPLEHMYEIGALGPNVVLNHMTALEDFEVDLVVESGTMVVHNPSSALKLSKGVSRTGKFPELLQRGVVVALGTDASNASNHSDIFRSMWLAVLLARDVRIDPTVTVAEDGLEMAITNGSKAAGWGAEIGMLAAGRKADLIVVDTDRADMSPSLDVVQDLVYSATGSCVTHSVINGRLVMDDRVLTTIDEREALRQHRLHAKALLDRIGHQVTPRWPLISS